MTLFGSDRINLLDVCLLSASKPKPSFPLIGLIESVNQGRQLQMKTTSLFCFLVKNKNIYAPQYINPVIV